MGCTQSKVDNEEAVTRCKERKLLMKEAVTARNVFASGQCGYAVYLKNTGAAISDFAHGESDYSSLQNQTQPPLRSVASQPQPPPPPPPPPSMTLPPPPPPLPNFSPSPIKRAMSMPEISLKQETKTRYDLEPVPVAIMEEDEEEIDEESELDHSRSRKQEAKESDLKKSQESRDLGKEAHVPPMPEAKSMAWDYFFMVDNMPGPSIAAEDQNTNDVRNEGVEFDDDVEPKTPEKAVEEKVEEVEEEEEEEEENEGAKQIVHSKTAPLEFLRMGVGMGAGAASGVPSVNLMQVLSEIDDHFLRASECAQEVSKMLEATRLHYHSNFADNRGLFGFCNVFVLILLLFYGCFLLYNGQMVFVSLSLSEFNTGVVILAYVLRLGHNRV